MQGLATNQDLLVKGEWREVRPRRTDPPPAGLHRRGPWPVRDLRARPARFRRSAAEAIGMAIHELAINALNMARSPSPAARSRSAGKWTRPARGLSLWWRERVARRSRCPSTRGFGTTLIADLPRAKLDAEVMLDYDPKGVQWSLKGKDLLAGVAEGSPRSDAGLVGRIVLREERYQRIVPALLVLGLVEAVALFVEHQIFCLVELRLGFSAARNFSNCLNGTGLSSLPCAISTGRESSAACRTGDTVSRSNLRSLPRPECAIPCGPCGRGNRCCSRAARPRSVTPAKLAAQR